MAASGDGVPAPYTTTAVEAIASPATSGAATSDPIASIGPTVSTSPSTPHMAVATTSTGADDNTIEEPKVIMGYPSLRAPETVSLSEAMGTTHFAMN
jgi:hypothetical protein